MASEWLSTYEVAQLLRVSMTAVHRLRWRQTLAYEWIGGRIVFRRSTIDDYLANDRAQKRRRGGRVDVGQASLDLSSAVDHAKEAKSGHR